MAEWQSCDSSLGVLRLVLDALRVPLRFDNLNDRKLIQKAIYLVQANRLPLAYQFGWYQLGPYCVELARHCSQLAERLEADFSFGQQETLREDVRSGLQELSRKLEVPAGEPAPTVADWYEALASAHYLLVELRESVERAAQVLREQKPHLTDLCRARALSAAQVAISDGWLVGPVSVAAAA